MKELSPEQVARLRPEARERYEKRLKIVKRNRKILKIVCITLAVVFIVLTLSMTVLFNISSINIGKQSDMYTADEIVMASGLNQGDNMLRTNFTKVEERIERSLPYVKDAVIVKNISGKITIDITDTKAAVIVKAPQGYFITDTDGKTLESIQSIPENNTLMVLKINGEVTASPGETIVFDDSDEEKLYEELKSLLESEGLFSGITEMDLTQRSSVKLIYQNRLRLLLGASDNLETKIKSGAQVIEKENAQDPELIAEVNLAIPKKVYVNPLETLYPVEEEPSEEETDSTETEDASGEVSDETGEETDADADEETTSSQDETADNEDTQQDEDVTENAEDEEVQE